MKRRTALAAAFVLLLLCIGPNAFAAAEAAEDAGLKEALSRKIEYPDWKGLKWTALGDSHTEVNYRAKMNYVTYIKKGTGIKTVNLGRSGMGWKKRRGFSSVVSRIPQDTDIVTVYGSFNDLGSKYTLGEKTDTEPKTLAGYINKTLDEIMERVPDARLGVITPCPWEEFTPLTGLVPEKGRPEDRSEEAIAYCRLICDICEMRGIPCLDLFHCSGLRPWEKAFRKAVYTRDGGKGCHPDHNGHKLITPYIVEFIGSLLAE